MKDFIEQQLRSAHWQFFISVLKGGGGAVKNITLYFARGWSLSLQKRCNLKKDTSNGLVLGLNLGAMNT